MGISDWFPTFIRLAGGNFTGIKPLDGVDQWNMLRHGGPSLRKIVLHGIDTMERPVGERLYNDTFDNRIKAAVRVGDYKLLTGHVLFGDVTMPPEEPLLHHPARKLNSSNDNLWLFNVAKDPSENHEISAQEPGKVRELLDILQTYLENSVEPNYPGIDVLCNPSLRGAVWGPWM